MGLALDNITWRPRMGDPSPLAWTITVGYFIACLLCYFAARRLRNSSNPEESSGRSWFWFTLMVVMFALGWNKQLDLQTLLTQVGRELARHGGWYSHRQSVQMVFVLCCAIAGFGFLALGLQLMRGKWKRFGLAYLGIVYLVTFVVIRAASFHHVDNLLYRLPIAGYWVNVCLELGGIFLVSVGALLGSREASPMVKDSKPRHSAEGVSQGASAT